MTMPSSDGDLAADRADAGQQRAAGLLVDERDQAEADRQLERVERQRVQRGVARRGQLRLVGAPRPRPRASAASCWREFGLLRSDQPTAKNSAADDEERELGQAGHEAEGA